MPEYGVQDDGSFEKKPIDVIRSDVKQQFKNQLGQDIELRDSSPLTQVINATTIEISKQWNAAEAAYYASFYEDSFGNQLNKQLALAGFSRRTLRGATGEVTFSRETAASGDVLIPEGTVVQSPRTDIRPRIPFATTEPATILSGDTQVTNVPIEALEPWETDVDEEWLGEETNLSPSTITEFENPISGVDSVTNPEATGDTALGFTEGRDRETDAQFKNRYQQSLAEGGAATRDAVRSAVFAADDDIASVDVEEVHDPANDEYGVRVTVLGPGVSDDTIAQAIFDSRAAGLESYGDQSGSATSDSGDVVTEQFNRAAELQVEVEATVTTDSTYSTNAEQNITDRLIRYVGGEDSDGLQYPGLGVGENVVYDQILRRIVNEQGVVELDVTIGPAGGTLDSDNIVVPVSEAPVLDAANVTITEA